MRTQKNPYMLIQNADIGGRIKNLAISLDFLYFRDFNGLESNYLLQFRNFGKKSIDELQKILEDLGMSLKFTPKPHKTKYRRIIKGSK